MPTEITVPRQGWSMEEAIFSAWLKQDGEMVCAGDMLFSIESDKATQEIESFDAGVLHLPPNAPQQGDKVLVGQVIGYLLAEGESAPGQKEEPGARCPVPGGAESAPMPIPQVVAPPVTPGKTGPQASTPRARRVARELGVDWTNFAGSGRDGRIREVDVRGQSSGALTSRSRVIVVTDWLFPDLTIEQSIVEKAGCNLVAGQCKTEAELIALVADADAVITQFARINANVIAAMNKARVIVRYGIGVDNVDLDAARVHGIPVCNIPDYCVDEVADHTLAFMLATTRQVVPNTLHLRGSKWGLALPVSTMQALKYLTVGVVGFGRIGREVVQRLRAFKARVLVFDPVVAAAEITKADAVAATSLDELLAQSDIVSLHCPSTPKTKQMFNAATFAKMKEGAIFINVSRGDLVDSTALGEALQCGKISAAALDVFDPEPIPADHAILKMPNVILAAHIASVSPAAVKTLRETAAHLALKAVRGEALPNIVNGVNPTR